MNIPVQYYSSKYCFLPKEQCVSSFVLRTLYLKLFSWKIDYLVLTSGSLEARLKTDFPICGKLFLLQILLEGVYYVKGLSIGQSIYCQNI